MLIPYNTDAPIYHFPYATIGLIVVNVLMYFGTASIAANDTGRGINVDIALAEIVQQFEAENGRTPTPEEIQEMKDFLREINSGGDGGSIWSLGHSNKVLWLTLKYDQINPLQWFCLLYTSPSPRDLSTSRMPSSA